MRHLAVPLVAVVLAVPASAWARPDALPRSHWARAEITAVVARGLMAPDKASFRPDDLLTRGELNALVAGLTGQPAARSANPGAPVSVSTLDASLVRAIGAQDAAVTFARSLRAAGLTPSSRFGTETVIRLLGLRENHPADRDGLERLPTEAATRAQAAYSAARMLRFRGGEADALRAAAASFVLPPLTPWQKRVLNTAFWFVGYPYVWGGESEFAAGPFGAQAQGGFDCSGLVWRVYKLQPYEGGALLPATLQARTTYAMSSEVSRSARIPITALEPGDLMFFGSRGPRSKPAQIDHMGMYAGAGWIVHSSRYGVALAPLNASYLERFAWGRRPLAEAGLATAWTVVRK
jgi:cell wall-associated NlpC family hydrolase